MPANAVTPAQGGGHGALTIAVDAAVRAVMDDDDTRIAGMTVAVSRNGKLLLNRGYGFANVATGEKMYSWKRARIGSVSKAVVTGPAGWQLMLEKGINPATKKLYGTGGVLHNTYRNWQQGGNRRFNPIVSMAIGPDDRVHTWYSDQTHSIGTSTNLTAHQPRLPFLIPLNRKPKDIRGIDIAKDGDVYAWYDDGTVSIGVPGNLGAEKVPEFGDDGKPIEPVKKPSGRLMSQIIDMAIAKSNDRVYTWYDDGTVSVGTSTDLDHYEERYDFTPLNDGALTSHTDIRGLGIAANDRVYAWYSGGKVSRGRSDDLAAVGVKTYATPNVPAAPNWETWYGEMTVQHILDHTAGFVDLGDVDGAVAHFGVAEADLTYPMAHSWMVYTKKLQFRPGTGTSYSSHGFGLWNLLVPAMTGGTSYKSYAINSYLDPLNLNGKIKPAAASPDANMSKSYKLDDGDFVEVAIGDSGIGLAAGGWTASAEALLRVTRHLMNTYGPDAMDKMGWGKASGGKLGHSGSIDGGRAYVAVFPPGYVSQSGADLSNVHVALVANTSGAADLRSLADVIALAVPAANVPASFNEW